MNNERATEVGKLGSIKLSLPKWYWIAATLAMLWYLMDLAGLASRVFMLKVMIEDFSDEQQALYRAMPLWVNFVFTVEVFGGLIGSLGLLFRRSWAYIFYIFSLFGVLAQTTYLWWLSDSIRIMGPPSIVMPVIALTIAVALIVFTRMARKKQLIE
jgi:hypothetical protein